MSQGIWVELLEQFFEGLWLACGRDTRYACYMPENALWGFESIYQGIDTSIVVALGETASVRRYKQGYVGIERMVKSEEALEIALSRHRVEKVDTARDECDSLVGVI